MQYKILNKNGFQINKDKLNYLSVVELSNDEVNILMSSGAKLQNVTMLPEFNNNQSNDDSNY